MSNKEEKVYKLSDLKEHNKRNDIWVAVHGKVYDLTGFLQNHPGGVKVLEAVGGTNGTREFDEQGHDDYHIDKLK